MPTLTNKQRVMNLLFSTEVKNKPAAEEPRPVLEQFLYAVCREGVTREQADRAYRQLREQFFDWNEVRVSSVRELADALQALPNAEGRAQRIVDFLQEVFETTFSFDLESLHKKGVKVAAKQLTRYQAANDYAVAWVIQQSLGGHAIPVDAPSLRALRRLGVLEADEQDGETLRASLEHQVAKARGALFIDLMSELAEEFCFEAEPACPACPLASACQFAASSTSKEPAGVGSAEFSGRTKPR
jgi:endonuclease-3